MAQILEPTRENIQSAAALLRAGEVIGMPTETVYGLAGSVFDEQALTRIFAVKERPTFDPLIVHVSQGILAAEPLLALSELVNLTGLQPVARERATALMRAFWPGPLTIVLPKTSRVPDLATSGLATVGLRVPRHAVAQALIEAAGVPLAAPSANRFGRISPTSPQHVEAELGDRISLILDGGLCDIGLESSVVTVLGDGTLVLLRPGAVSRDQLAAAAGTSVELASKPYCFTAGLSAPGMLESHYAPKRPLTLLPGPVAELTREAALAIVTEKTPAGPLGLLLQAGDDTELGRKFAYLTGRDVIARTLSPRGDLTEAARNLFSYLRQLDNSGATALFAEPCVGIAGLGHAIADRLRAAGEG